MTDIYDDQSFFEAYSQMPRSKYGLSAAGKWHELRKLFPDFTGKTVLDLDCGYGWHCRYAADHGAKEVVGIDASSKMIDKTQAMTTQPNIHYHIMDIMAIDQLEAKFDVIISSLAIHYIKDYGALIEKIHNALNVHGHRTH